MWNMDFQGKTTLRDVVTNIFVVAAALNMTLKSENPWKIFHMSMQSIQ